MDRASLGMLSAAGREVLCDVRAQIPRRVPFFLPTSAAQCWGSAACKGIHNLESRDSAARQAETCQALLDSGPTVQPWKAKPPPDSGTHPPDSAALFPEFCAAGSQGSH